MYTNTNDINTSHTLQLEQDSKVLALIIYNEAIKFKKILKLRFRKNHINVKIIKIKKKN